MPQFNEKGLYTGLAAQHWSAISSTDSRWDQEYYRALIERQDGPALELGCGAGRLLLAYLKDGLDVTGSDISGDMLAVCREQAAEAGLEPVLYEQSMQDLDIPQRFRTIYIACGTFVCVTDRRAAVETLRRCRAHLAPGGVLVFNIHLADYDYSQTEVPKPNPEWQFKAEKQLPAGRRLVVSYREAGLDPVEQIWREERRYELYEGDRLIEAEEQVGQGRWYFRNEVLTLLELAGFTDVTVTGDYTDEPYGPQHTSCMVFTCPVAGAIGS